jgi:hypothetical protein
LAPVRCRKVCPDANALHAEVVAVLAVGVTDSVATAVAVGEVVGDAVAEATGLTLAVDADALTDRLAADEEAAVPELDEVAAHPVPTTTSAVAKTAAPNPLSIRGSVMPPAPCNRDEWCPVHELV